MLTRRLPAAGMERGWSIRDALARSRQVWRDQGAQALWFKTLGELCYRRLVLIERSLAGPVPPIGTDLRVTIEAHERDAAERELDVSGLRGDFTRAIRPGDRAFLIRGEDGRILHICWVAEQAAWIPYVDVELRLSPGSALVYGAHTAPEVRGHNLSALRSAYMLAFYRDRGFKRTLAAVDGEDARALRPTAKVGYRRIGVIGRVWLGPLERRFLRAPAGRVEIGSD